MCGGTSSTHDFNADEEKMRKSKCKEQKKTNETKKEQEQKPNRNGYAGIKPNATQINTDTHTDTYTPLAPPPPAFYQPISTSHRGTTPTNLPRRKSYSVGKNKQARTTTAASSPPPRLHQRVRWFPSFRRDHRHSGNPPRPCRCTTRSTTRSDRTKVRRRRRRRSTRSGRHLQVLNTRYYVDLFRQTGGGGGRNRPGQRRRGARTRM